MSSPTHDPTRLRNRAPLVVLAALAALVAALALVLGGIPSAGASKRASAVHPRRHACHAVARDLRRTDETLDDLVAAGTLDRTQADAVATALAEDAPAGARACLDRIARHAQVVEDVSDLLDLAADEIRDRLLDGDSLTEIAASQGVDRATLVATLQDAVTERLDEAVAADRITETRRAELEARAFAAIDRLVDHQRGDRLPPEGTDDATPSPIPTPAAARFDSESRSRAPRCNKMPGRLTTPRPASIMPRPRHARETEPHDVELDARRSVRGRAGPPAPRPRTEPRRRSADPPHPACRPRT